MNMMSKSSTKTQNCTLMATNILTDASEARIIKAFKSTGAYNPITGTKFHLITKSLKLLNLNCEDSSVRAQTRSLKTTRQVALKETLHDKIASGDFNKGNYLVHVIEIIDNDTENFSFHTTAVSDGRVFSLLMKPNTKTFYYCHHKLIPKKKPKKKTNG
jgi:hypothetical protein